MTSIAIVQARMGSSRLPGKVAMKIAGIPALVLMLERVRGITDETVVATSTEAIDDKVVELATSAGIPVVRGSESDVLSRYVQTLDSYPADIIVRLTADCPLMDPALIRLGLNTHVARHADFTSNTLVRTYPDGLDVEVMTSKALREAAAEAVDPVEREHVTPFIIRRPERFKLVTFRDDALLGDLRWTLDSQDDLLSIQHIAHRVADLRTAPWQDFLTPDDGSTLPRERIRLRPAQSGDSQFALTLRNDPTALKWRRDTSEVSTEEHAQWFASAMFSPAERIWIATINERAVGQVRVRVRSGVGTTSIDVATPSRGQGFATPILLGLQDRIRCDFQVTELRAMVHEDNLASAKSFSRAGFHELSHRDGAFRSFVWQRF